MEKMLAALILIVFGLAFVGILLCLLIGLPIYNIVVWHDWFLAEMLWGTIGGSLVFTFLLLWAAITLDNQNETYSVKKKDPVKG
jgi:hypothetical protein